VTGLPLTIRHVYDFGADRSLVGDDLVRPEVWDALRTQTAGAFSLPEDRAAWESAATARPDLCGRAEAIDEWLRAQSVPSLASYGVGGASLEFLLSRASPDRRMVVSDYGPATVQRLAQVFPEVQVAQFDLLRDAPLDAAIHLFHRIDTEFTNRVWRDVLHRFRTERVLLIASDVISLRRASWEIRLRLRSPRASKAGWLRNRAAFERLWSRTHTATPLRLHDLQAWDLRPKS
jgi:hypothetical protein